MTRQNDRLYLGHMLDNARLAVRLRDRTTRDIFKDDEITQLAFIHIVQIIGEAARNVSPEGCAQFPELPWAQITGMRHRLVHDYSNVNLDLVWDTLVNDIP